jgi:transketolase
MAFGQELIELAKENESFVLCSADTKTCGLEKFGQLFPGREFSFGIAEQNLVGGAAGLASCGNKVYLATFAVFASMRACEQVRTFVCYPKLNVTIIGTHTGLQVGGDGATHAAVEDVAIMRALPNIVAEVPCDNYEAIAATHAMIEHNGPFYYRCGYKGEKDIHSGPIDFKIGKANTVREGSDVTLMFCGPIGSEVVEAAEMLKKDGINCRVVSMHTIKPIDKEAVVAAAKECGGRIITAEEHSVIGGLGEAVCAVLAEKYPARVRRIGLQDVFGYSGPMAQLMVEFCLDETNIVKTVKEFLAE